MNSVLLVTQREVKVQARSKSFWIGTLVMVVAAFVSAFLPGVFADDDDQEGQGIKVAVVGLEELRPVLEGLDLSELPDTTAAEQAVREGQVEAALVPAADAPPLGVRVLALEEAPTEVLGRLSVTPPVELLDAPEVDPFLRIMAGMVFAMLYFMIVVSYGQLAAQSTVVEKQTRVIEIILATVSAKVLLAGKILANSVLALGTVLLIATALILGLVAGGTGSMLTEQASALVAAGAPGAGVWEVVGPPLACFVVFFAAAFVLFCALMVGPAAMVSRLEDVGTVLMPSMLLCMGPYILVISFPENQTLINWLSFIPFSSGIAMPIRLIGGEVPWWQLATSFGILLVSTYLTILLAGRLYSGSILRTGARVKFMDAFKTQG